MRDRYYMVKKYNKVFIIEVRESAKQRLTALASKLRRYTREADTNK